MVGFKTLFTALLPVICAASPLFADEGGETAESGEIFTLWPLIDYRESPADGYSNLALLGPLFKFQRQKEHRDVAVRPLFYRRTDDRSETAATEYLYPLATSDTAPDVSTFQVIHLFQKNTFRRDEPEKQEKGTMFFPFYISGKSEKYGPYTSVFPIYGDLYERFWRDEYHYILFPLYGRTVKKGTTTRNYLYPIFSTISGEKESGFQVWPLYGESAKEGVYRKHFVLWPFYTREESGLDTDAPTSKRYLLPFYAATDSPQLTSRYYPWPFVGYRIDRKEKLEERDYFWPFVRTIRGEKRSLDSFLPLYSREEGKESRKQWYLWPLYKHEELDSAVFRQERDRLLYFLYSDKRESWPDGAERRRTAFWPLFLYRREPGGIKSLSFPAPVEPVLDREGIERNWAPLWRLYQQKWNDSGDSAASLLWNLYWHERRGDDLAYELFPLIAYRSEKKSADLKLAKGLFRYRNDGGRKTMSLFWLPFGLHWGKGDATSEVVAGMNGGSRP